MLPSPSRLSVSEWSTWGFPSAAAIPVLSTSRRHDAHLLKPARSILACATLGWVSPWSTCRNIEVLPPPPPAKSVVENCYRTRARLGANQSRLGVAPNTLTGMYSAGMVQLPMRTVNDTCLAYAAGLAMNSQYNEAVQLISEIQTDPSKRDALHIPDYLLGLIYWRTERWPDVLSTLGTIEWRESVILDAVNYMAGMASAHLGMFIEAGRKLDAISPSTPGTSAIYDRALLERAYIHREEGDESQARALFETIHTRRSDPDLVSSAARALADPQDRIKVVTDRWIATRTDYWDPSSAVGLEAIGASAGRAEILKMAAESLDRLVGLEAVKEDIKDIESNVRVTQKLREKGLPAGELTENILLSGPAGTGKNRSCQDTGQDFRRLRGCRNG